MNFDYWYNRTIGQPVNIDHAFGDQCVDVAMSWSNFLFNPLQWYQTLGYGDAKDLYNGAYGAYFDKIPAKPGLVAKQGDMPVYKGTPGNPEGHIAVVRSADATMHVIEQNGYNPSGVAYNADRPYINLIGLLRPKGVGMNPLNKGDIVNVYRKFLGHDPNENDFEYHLNQNKGDWNHFVYDLMTRPDLLINADFTKVTDVLFRKK